MKPPLDINNTFPQIAPCEHIAGNEKFIRKAFELQQQHITPSGRSLVDITLDLEDGAPVGQEEALRELAVKALTSPSNSLHQTGVRVHAPDSPHFIPDLHAIARNAGSIVSYITIPKVRSPCEVALATAEIQKVLEQNSITRHIPIHTLIETPDALRFLDEIAAIPEVQALPFGLLDFISHLGGAISAECMRSPGQFDHRIIGYVKEKIALAALGHSKIPTQPVTVDVRNPEQAFLDARRARVEFGFLRMWSIHPSQVEPILRGMLPSADEVSLAREIVEKAEAANWGPIEYKGQLHDRASFRYYWQVLQRVG